MSRLSLTTEKDQTPLEGHHVAWGRDRKSHEHDARSSHGDATDRSSRGSLLGGGGNAGGAHSFGLTGSSLSSRGSTVRTTVVTPIRAPGVEPAGREGYASPARCLYDALTPQPSPHPGRDVDPRPHGIPPLPYLLPDDQTPRTKGRDAPDDDGTPRGAVETEIDEIRHVVLTSNKRRRISAAGPEPPCHLLDDLKDDGRPRTEGRSRPPPRPSAGEVWIDERATTTPSHPSPSRPRTPHAQLLRRPRASLRGDSGPPKGLSGRETDLSGRETGAVVEAADPAVRAILRADPPTQTRAVHLRPGYAPPSPQTPLWLGLGAEDEEGVGGAGGNEQAGEANEPEEEEETWDPAVEVALTPPFGLAGLPGDAARASPPGVDLSPLGGKGGSQPVSLTQEAAYLADEAHGRARQLKRSVVVESNRRDDGGGPLSGSGLSQIPASQATRQKMASWIAQTRSFFRFIDERTLVCVSDTEQLPIH